MVGLWLITASLTYKIKDNNNKWQIETRIVGPAHYGVPDISNNRVCSLFCLHQSGSRGSFLLKRSPPVWQEVCCPQTLLVGCVLCVYSLVLLGMLWHSWHSWCFTYGMLWHMCVRFGRVWHSLICLVWFGTVRYAKYGSIYILVRYGMLGMVTQQSPQRSLLPFSGSSSSSKQLDEWNPIRLLDVYIINTCVQLSAHFRSSAWGSWKRFQSHRNISAEKLPRLCW